MNKILKTIIPIAILAILIGSGVYYKNKNTAPDGWKGLLTPHPKPVNL